VKTNLLSLIVKRDHCSGGEEVRVHCDNLRNFCQDHRPPVRGKPEERNRIRSTFPWVHVVGSLAMHPRSEIDGFVRGCITSVQGGEITTPINGITGSTGQSSARHPATSAIMAS